MERLTPERRRELTRNALIDAAAKRFASEGFNAASLDDIADDAGFTKGAIYSNFAGKDELFLAVLERHNEKALETWQAMVRDGLETGHLAAGWSELLDANLDWFTLTLEFRLYALRNSALRDRFTELERAGREATAKLIEQTAEAAGQSLLISAESLAVLGMAISEEIVWRSYLDPEDEDLEQDFLVVMARAFADRPTPSRSRPGRSRRTR